MDEKPPQGPPIPRRALLGGSLVAALAGFARAHGMESPLPPPTGRARRASVERDDVGVVETAMHGGAGKLRVKWFDFGGTARPALLITYVIPPGASEGVHTHKLGDRAAGSYDEFYYVLQGSGVMQLGDETIPITAGDHILAPLGVPHGVANPGTGADLKILLTTVERS